MWWTPTSGTCSLQQFVVRFIICMNSNNNTINPFGPIINKYCACALTKLIPRGSRFTGSVCVRECNQHENARDVSRKIPSDFWLLKEVELPKKNGFQRVSATGERDMLDSTQVSLAFCVYIASPWAARAESISYGGGKEWRTLFTLQTRHS